MKNFSDLLATQPDIDIEISITVLESQQVIIVVNGQEVYNQWTVNDAVWSGSVPLPEPLTIQVSHKSAYVVSLLIDGWQARPHWGSDSHGLWKFDTESLPFYQWHHTATGQGWLLIPQL